MFTDGARAAPRRIQDLRFTRQLGQGYFGEVWECEPADGAPREGLVFAVKKVPLSLISHDKLMRQMQREIEIQRSLDHPNIVKLLFDFRDDEHIYLGMEYAEGGELFALLSRKGCLTNERAARYFYEMCDALAYLHGRPEKVIHRDIKPENILLDRAGRAKLADFGWSNSLKEQSSLQTFCGTQEYLAPEMIARRGHNESLDMWEMGVLLFEMLVGRNPFRADDQKETVRKISAGELDFPGDMHPDAQDLVRSLCRVRPEERLTAMQAREHAFVRRFFRLDGELAQEALPSLGQVLVEVQQLRQDKARLEAQVRRLQEASDASEEARALREDNKRLQGEVQHLLQAKGATEESLLVLSAELDEVHAMQRRELRLRVQADVEIVRLQAREAELLRELEALHRDFSRSPGKEPRR